MPFSDNDNKEIQDGMLVVKENYLVNEIRRLKYTHAHLHTGACTHACGHTHTHRHIRVHAHT